VPPPQRERERREMPPLREREESAVAAAERERVECRLLR
jgi:hypothetical protein